MKKIFQLTACLSIYFSSAFSQTNTFPASGNVGIGTISPAAALHVNGNASIFENNGAGMDYPNIRLVNTSAPTLNTGEYRADISIDHTSGALTFRNVLGKGYNFMNSPNNVHLFHISENGNIGIGTTSPTQKLSVVGQGVFLASGATTYDPGDGIGSAIRIGFDANMDYGYINANNTGVTGKNLIIQGNGGNVGIGTAWHTPLYTVSVDGTIAAKKVIVTQTVWADYVFDKHYKLPTLEGIEKFIKINKHLPDMPSTKDVEKNGINLGENQALLLKKIEELTLIIIEQNKRINALEKQSKK